MLKYQKFINTKNSTKIQEKKNNFLPLKIKKKNYFSSEKFLRNGRILSIGSFIGTKGVIPLKILATMEKEIGKPVIFFFNFLF